MTAKPIVLRERARQDISEAVDYYAREASEQIALEPFPLRMAHSKRDKKALNHRVRALPDRQTGPTLAGSAPDFIDTLANTYRAIAHFPAIGSPRYAHELNLTGLRSQRLTPYPYLVFYVERDDRIDVWRVLQAQRDIPAWMEKPEDA